MKNNLNMGVTLEKTKEKLCNLSKKFTKEIYDNYIDGKITSSDLPTILGVNRYTIELYMKKTGLKFRKDVLRKSIENTFFDNIDNEKKAYMLGYYYADGNCNLKHGNVSITQTKSDSYIIELFQQLSPHTKITETKECVNKKTGYISKPTLSISIGSKHMAETLESYGIGHNKTYESKTDFSFIPENLMIHFIRGYFDGDGTVCVTNGKKKIANKNGEIKEYNYSNYTWQIICHNKEPLAIIQAFLSKKYDIYSNIIQEKRGGNYLLLVNRKKEFFKLRDVLYKDASYFLSRKKDKYFSF